MPDERTKRVVTLEQTNSFTRKEPEDLGGYRIIDDKTVECDHPKTHANISVEDSKIKIQEVCEVCGETKTREIDSIL